jgi:UDP-glucose 4-epimerase
MSMKILVTGGAGYVGGIIAGECCHHVMALDMEEAEFPDGWDCGSIACSLLSDKLPEVLCSYKPDVVIHAAALTYPAESQRAPLAYWQTNVEGTRRLLHAMTLAGTRNIVFLSSSSVYGNAICDAHGKHGLFPASVYGQTKLAGEQMIKAWVSQGEKATEPQRRGARILRLTNVAGAVLQWGENQGESLRILPAMLRNIAGDPQPLCIYGAGRGQLRQFVHPHDVAKAAVVAAQQLGSGGCDTVTCNVVGDRGRLTSMLDLAAVVEDVTGRRLKYTQQPARDCDPPVVQMLADAKRVLPPWEPTYSLLDIVRSAWTWHERHPEWQHRCKGSDG